MAFTKIKFCGMSRLEDAELAVELGAWAIGLIFHRPSPRSCRPEVAAAIAADLRRRTEVVGVFVNPTLEQLSRLTDGVGLTMLQLHGEEGPAFCAEAARRTGCRVIKAARVRSGADIQALTPFRTDFHLLDGYVAGQPGGTGETFAWELARRHRGRTPVILSGGLRADNVAEGIRTVRPFAVDVASGIERAPGVKDHQAMRDFAAAVRASDPEEVRAPAEAAADAAEPPPVSHGVPAAQTGERAR